MSRFVLAFSCFFRILFGKKLPADAIRLLPETTGFDSPLQIDSKADTKPEPQAANGQAKAVAKPDTKPATKQDAKPDPARVVPVARPVEVDKPRISTAQHHRDGALALLALLQREGRLVDFLREPLDGFADADIGAAARDVHRGCRKVLEQHLTFEPVMPGAEEAKVSVPKGFDPAEIRLIGEARGEPPFRGTLRHHGWRVVDAKLPTLSEGVDRMVVAPAEVEL
ncbi:MAG: DUF2760 domain-containing protein [Myxococcales bacterium]|nr:DUF2760 domain-containing protein [Myxococcales bacterium]